MNRLDMGVGNGITSKAIGPTLRRAAANAAIEIENLAPHDVQGVAGYLRYAANRPASSLRRAGGADVSCRADDEPGNWLCSLRPIQLECLDTDG